MTHTTTKVAVVFTKTGAEAANEAVNEAPAESIALDDNGTVLAAAKKKLDNQSESEVDLHSAEYYFNRELSHLAFNQRVLEQATDYTHPLLERLKFLLIFSANMDEFYEIRVSGLRKQIDFGREDPGPDHQLPHNVLKEINQRAHRAIEQQYQILNDILIPELESEGIRFLKRATWTEQQAQWARKYFRTEVLPVISPLGLDPAHPFPRLVNKSMNFILSLEGTDAFGRESGLAIVPAPRSLPRVIKLPDRLCESGDNFVFLSAIIHAHVDELFPGMQVKECHQFRLTRNADFEMNAAEVEDIALALKGELHSRRFGSEIKLEISALCPTLLSDFLLNQFNLKEEELFRIKGPVNVQRIFPIFGMIDRPDLCFPLFVPTIPSCFKNDKKIFESIEQEDRLLLHPYQSFSPVIDLLRGAAKDPDVVAIKQTLYRTGESSELVTCLTEAARNGKEVTVVIELRARFDEEENLLFASLLQEAGAVVVYGVLGYKTHAKMLMIVRRQGKALRRYVHLGTGNYHPGNARVYTDYSLLTSDEAVCNDVHKVFQQLTGMGKAIKTHHLLTAPFQLKKSMIAMINNEGVAAQEGRPARILAKMNALTEPKVIRALYLASQKGVKIDLIIRGTCCLRPGVVGISENIRVVSVIGRFLEHSRVYYFENAEQQLYCSSADWMERNLMRRVETAFPIYRSKLVNRIKRELEWFLNDNTQAWLLQADGSYKRRVPRVNSASRSVQQHLLETLI